MKLSLRQTGLANSVWFGIIFILTIYSILLGGEQPLCTHCQKSIADSQYIEINDDYFHQNHFLCSGCNKALSEDNFGEFNGKYYDSLCLEKVTSPNCSSCGKPLTASRMILGAEVYHRRCYNEHIAVRCALCNQIIQGTYISDFWGNKYHSRHKRMDSRCDYCQRFISDKLTRGGLKYDDGRVICKLCLSGAASTAEKVTSYLGVAQMMLENYGIVIDNENVSFEFVSKNQLANLDANNTSKTQAYTKHVTIYDETGAVNNHLYQIYMLSDIPRLHFFVIAADQLMRIWIYQNAAKNIEPGLLGGSCWYASYLIAKEIGDIEGDYFIHTMESNPDSRYAKDYQRVKRFISENSIEQWISHLRKGTEFPQ